VPAPHVHLEPVLEVRYRRATLVALAGGERITIDWDLAYVDPATGLEVAHLRDGLHVVERKSQGRRSPGEAVLRELHARPVRCSKFALGIALLHPELPANDLRPLLRRAFGRADDRRPGRNDR
jgi:hypothetical protein